MKTIDTRSGAVLKPGTVLDRSSANADGTVTKSWTRILAIKPGIFSAKVQYTNDYLERTGKGPQWLPLLVRFTHRSFMFQHVAFFQS